MGYPIGGYRTFLVIAIATHAVVGYTLGAVLFDAPRAGALGGVLPDADFLFPAAWEWPLVHRGITHTALALGLSVAIAARWGRPIAGGVGAGYLPHLLVDATTPKGVPFAYPLWSESVFVPLRGHSTAATVLLWLGCLAVLWWVHASSRDSPDVEDSGSSRAATEQ